MLSPKKTGFFRKIDYWVLIPVLIALCFGFTAIYSSTHSFRMLAVQGTALLIGLSAIVLLTFIDYDNIGQLAPYIFGLDVIILTIVLFIGTGDEVGTRGWIDFGIVSLQPAELVKIGFIITFAKHIDHSKDNLRSPVTVLLLLLHLGVMVALVLLQPDTGTALVFCFIAAIMLFIAGLDWRYIASAAGVAVCSLPIAWFFLLKDFQKQRFLTFLNPESDLLGSGYHVYQSKIAVGSGSVLGRGLFKGVQTQFGYLPEKETDFIYSVIGEEFGFWGTIIVLSALIVLIIRCYYLASRSRDTLGELLCVGVGSMFLFHVIENVCMCIGLLPVTGIPLPFVSSGGSHMLACMLALALITNIRNRQNQTIF